MEGCEKPNHAQTLCKTHYTRARLGGELNISKRLPLDERFWAKVAKSDGCWNWTGQVNELGYGLFWRDGRGGHRAHRIAWELTNGPIPEGMVLDHRCHNATCVNPDHLRVCTQKQNTEHKRGAYRGNPSGIRGVHWRKDTNKWTGSVMHNYKKYNVGCFDTKREAEAAVIALRLELFTHNDVDRRAA
jgi:hypothetical protein